MNKNIVTKEWLDKENACIGSYSWLQKQQNKDWRAIANKLYAEQKYNWCLWLLYRKTVRGKAYVWLLILLSFILSGISIAISLNYDSNAVATVAATAFVVAAAVFVVAAFAVADATTITFAVVAAVSVATVVAAAAATVVAAAAASVAAAAAVAAVVAFAAVAVAAFTFECSNETICKIILREIYIRR